MMDIEYIKQSISMNNILSRYGFEKSRTDFINCPFHNEKTPSMKIYENSYYCFGCGKNGDVISFVMELFSINFNQAVVRLNFDFSLGLSSEKPDHKQQDKLIKARQEKQKIKDEHEAKYWAISNELTRLRRNIMHCAPLTATEPPCAFFLEGLDNISYMEHLEEQYPNKPYNLDGYEDTRIDYERAWEVKSWSF